MKKIPCVFQRDFSNKQAPKLLEVVTPGCEWVLAGEGVATRKWDGSACLVRGGKLFKRYDAKKGKTPPPGFEAAQEADPVTGHLPGWIPVDVINPDPQDVWHALAWWQEDDNCVPPDGTYELIGPRVNSNHEKQVGHRFVRHGVDVLTIPKMPFDGPSPMTTFHILRGILLAMSIEGIVFWREPGNVNSDMAKITRENYGLQWPVEEQSK